MQTTLPIADPRTEERAARDELRRVRRLQAGAAQARRRAWRQQLRNAVRDTGGRWPECRCDLRGVTTADQLHSMGCGCTDPFYCCPRLDAIRRRVGG